MVRILLPHRSMDASTALATVLPIPAPRPAVAAADGKGVISALAQGAEAEADRPTQISPAPSTPVDGSRGRGQQFELILNELSAGEPFADAERLITVDELERRYIERVLALTSGNKSRAAQILGFDRRTLYRKIERYGRCL
jgi:DNA-binding NtrC family response regulator